ncbi:MAG: hypothetical protein JSS78_04770 [Bacteroidetes bacterium]|nr:hypothetical protein [Bacteroidota bacterium]
MKATAICILLFALQLFLTLKGVEHWGKFVNPFLLFLSFVALFIYYIKSIFKKSSFLPPSKLFSILWFIIGMAVIVVCFPLFHQLFHQFNHPVDISDVLPQIEFQFDAFRHGELPYHKINLPHSKPFPVYMPFHWLPLSFTQGLGIDARWSGLLLLSIAGGIYASLVIKQEGNIFANWVLLLMPTAVLFSFLFWDRQSIAVSLETTIAAYYWILAMGLFKRSFTLTSLGVILCLLSRYTLIFWLPLYFLLLFWKEGRKKPTELVFLILISFFVFYIAPFLLREPSIFLTGLAYHNGAAEYEWEYGAWSFETGIYFAPHINALVAGSFTHKVFIARIIQATTLQLIFLGGSWFFRMQKNKINHYDFALGMLYLTIVCFYMIGPLTYRYYMITPLFLSTVLCARIINVSLKNGSVRD